MLIVKVNREDLPEEYEISGETLELLEFTLKETLSEIENYIVIFYLWNKELCLLDSTIDIPLLHHFTTIPLTEIRVKIYNSEETYLKELTKYIEIIETNRMSLLIHRKDIISSINLSELYFPMADAGTLICRENNKKFSSIIELNNRECYIIYLNQKFEKYYITTLSELLIRSISQYEKLYLLSKNTNLKIVKPGAIDIINELTVPAFEVNIENPETLIEPNMVFKNNSSPANLPTRLSFNLSSFNLVFSKTMLRVQMRRFYQYVSNNLNDFGFDLHLNPSDSGLFFLPKILMTYRYSRGKDPMDKAKNISINKELFENLVLRSSDVNNFFEFIHTSQLILSHFKSLVLKCEENERLKLIIDQHTIYYIESVPIKAIPTNSMGSAITLSEYLRRNKKLSGYHWKIDSIEL